MAATRAAAMASHRALRARVVLDPLTLLLSLLSLLLGLLVLLFGLLFGLLHLLQGLLFLVLCLIVGVVGREAAGELRTGRGGHGDVREAQRLR